MKKIIFAYLLCTGIGYAAMIEFSGDFSISTPISRVYKYVAGQTLQGSITGGYCSCDTSNSTPNCTNPFYSSTDQGSTCYDTYVTYVNPCPSNPAAGYGCDVPYYFPFYRQPVPILNVTNSGLVGINKEAPASELDIAGTVKATAFQGDGSTLSGVASSSHNHNTAYSSISHNHDAVYAKLSGGSMSGPLSVTGAVTSTGLDVNGTAMVNSIAYATPQARYWSLSGAELIPYSSGASFTKGFDGLTSTGATFTAPVHLPHGATVTKMTVHYLDNHLTDNFSVAFDRLDMVGAVLALATLTTSSTNAAFREGVLTTFTDPVVDNSLYAYRISVFGMNGLSSHKFGGVVIEYTVDEPLP